MELFKRMKIFCPKCNQKYDLTEEFIGEEVECFVCNYEFEVKLPEEPSASTPETPPEKDKTEKKEPGIGKTVPTTLATPLAVPKKAVIIPEKPLKPVVKKAIVTPEVAEEKVPPPATATTSEKNDAAEKTIASQPQAAQTAEPEPQPEKASDTTSHIDEGVNIPDENAPLPVEEKLALARKKAEQAEEELDEPKVTVTRSLFKLPDRSKQNLIQDDESHVSPDEKSSDGQFPKYIDDEDEEEEEGEDQTETAEKETADLESENSKQEKNEDEFESFLEKAKKAFDNSGKVSAPESKKKYIIVMVAVFCMLLGNAGIAFSPQMYSFIPAVVLLLAAFLLSLAIIYQRQVVYGLLILVVTLAVPSYVFTENLDKGIAKLFGHTPLEYAVEDQKNEKSAPNEEKKTDLSDLYGYPEKDNPKQNETVQDAQIQKIQGAFGFHLGEIFKPKSASDNMTIATGETLYRIKPKEKFRKFNTYYVLITPVSKKIYGIWAEVDLKNRPQAEREFKVVLTLLEKKYETKAAAGIIPSMLRKSIKINNRTITLSSSIIGEVKLHYTDDLLKAQADKEAVMQEASKQSPNQL